MAEATFFLAPGDVTAAAWEWANYEWVRERERRLSASGGSGVGHRLKGDDRPESSDTTVDAAVTASRGLADNRVTDNDEGGS